MELTLMKLAYLNGAVQFVRDLTPASNGETKKKTSSIVATPITSTAPNTTGHTPTANPVYEAPVTNAPADGPEPLPVENGVQELHTTPSIEPDPSEPITTRHQVRDTLPHVETGRPSMQGLEPTHRSTDVRPGTIVAPSGTTTPLPALPKLPILGNRLPSLRDVGTPNALPATKPTAVAEPGLAPSTDPLSPIAPDLLRTVWQQLADERRAQEKMSDYMVLNRPVAADASHVITLIVDNPVQVVQFNDFRAEFMAELRRRTGHSGLTVQTEVATAAPTGRKLYTSNDKFAYLAEKYPALQEMKQRLGLDADF
ncbi:MAG: hypothetical protein EOO60_12065 [Hymenobacter sp.]|nr:MAG: hypothetical protein EOO60_12065 [Hymenobacter sp.]